MDDVFDSWLMERCPEADPSDARLVSGVKVGDYVVDALLGRGGFAEVYKAHVKTGELVAIKMLYRLDDRSRARFEREGRILARIHHRNLLRFFGSGEFEGRPYLVTEFLYPLELPNRDRTVARFMKAVMSAVEALHRHGFVHRDVKPANVLRRESGEPVLIDFGLAERYSCARGERSVHSAEMDRNQAAGTVGFSAPEQFVGNTSGPASDIHALGAMVGACFGDAMPGPWRRIYLTATNSNPSVRYQSVEVLRRAISLRHFRRVAFAVLAVVLLGASLYAVAKSVQRHSVENRQPHRFQERG